MPVPWTRTKDFGIAVYAKTEGNNVSFSFWAEEKRDVPPKNHVGFISTPWLARLLKEKKGRISREKGPKAGPYAENIGRNEMVVSKDPPSVSYEDWAPSANAPEIQRELEQTGIHARIEYFCLRYVKKQFGLPGSADTYHRNPNRERGNQLIKRVGSRENITLDGHMKGIRRQIQEWYRDYGSPKNKATAGQKRKAKTKRWLKSWGNVFRTKRY